MTRTLFHKIPQKKVSDRVFDQIRELIISGRLAPGDRLPPERELTGLLDVSRSSVREAILKLECLGFVEQCHGEGTFVRSVTETPLTEFFKELIR
ncbi:MAG: GntR family transcriptional regulator, partial [Oceanisphaera sp.]|nr:GntR family transcriptional regulator [Oceanisphaera sp.]